VVVRGSTTRTTSAPLLAAATILRMRTSASVFVAPAHPSSEILRSVILKTEAGVWGLAPNSFFYAKNL